MMIKDKSGVRAAIRETSEIKPVPEAKSHPNVIVLDTETTGLVAGRDHLLTVGICDGDGREVDAISKPRRATPVTRRDAAPARSKPTEIEW